ncbi:MAG TPA: SAM-dependent methyltransferase [Actinocrinis sp.]|nr:SAM-dependent methyltransferase [Actinocrinis sp.]
MRHRPAWAPDEIDIERPSAARMYDYYLGGSYNFAADRALAEENMRAWPDMPHITRANRAYPHRAVTLAVKASNVYTQAGHALTFRSREQVAGLMQGYELVEPGLVDIVHWRPDLLDTSPDPLGGDVRRYSGYAAVGCKAEPGLSA